MLGTVTRNPTPKAVPNTAGIVAVSTNQIVSGRCPRAPVGLNESGTLRGGEELV
jgi:hypothetical protein